MSAVLLMHIPKSNWWINDRAFVLSIRRKCNDLPSNQIVHNMILLFVSILRRTHRCLTYSIREMNTTFWFAFGIRQLNWSFAWSQPNDARRHSFIWRLSARMTMMNWRSEFQNSTHQTETVRFYASESRVFTTYQYQYLLLSVCHESSVMSRARATQQQQQQCQTNLYSVLICWYGSVQLSTLDGMCTRHCVHYPQRSSTATRTRQIFSAAI